MSWVSVPECTPSGNVQLAVTNPLDTRRRFWTFAVLTWALAMLVAVVDLPSSPAADQGVL
jgi:hypothetical protein